MISDLARYIHHMTLSLQYCRFCVVTMQKWSGTFQLTVWPVPGGIFVFDNPGDEFGKWVLGEVLRLGFVEQSTGDDQGLNWTFFFRPWDRMQEPHDYSFDRIKAALEEK